MIRYFVYTFTIFSFVASHAFAQDEILEQTSVVESSSWFSPEYWGGSFEVGLNGAEGNTKSFNLLSGFDLKRETSISEIGFKIAYAKTTTNGIDTQHFARSNWDYDRLFAEGSPWSFYSKTSMLYDEFQGFDLRVISNFGLGYKWWDTEKSLLRTRAGLGVSREFGGVSNEFVPEANLGIDFRKQLSARQKLNVTVDYYPAWSDFQDYRLVTDASWELLLDQASNLSLKMTVFDTYDSTPDPGTTNNDLKYGLLLLWNM